MTLSYKDALMAFIKHMALASGAVLILLIGIEWLIPGAVLPFVDVFDWLLPISVLLLVVLAREVTSSRLSRWWQMMLVVLVSLMLLAILTARMESHSLADYSLMFAVALCLVVWVLATAKPT